MVVGFWQSNNALLEIDVIYVYSLECLSSNVIGVVL